MKFEYWNIMQTAYTIHTYTTSFMHSFIPLLHGLYGPCTRCRTFIQYFNCLSHVEKWRSKFKQNAARFRLHTSWHCKMDNCMLVDTFLYSCITSIRPYHTYICLIFGVLMMSAVSLLKKSFGLILFICYYYYYFCVCNGEKLQSHSNFFFFNFSANIHFKCNQIKNQLRQRNHQHYRNSSSSGENSQPLHLFHTYHIRSMYTSM